MDKLWSLEAEAGVIGSILVDSRHIGSLLPILDETSFYKPEHQTIYDALTKLYAENKPTDGIALRTELTNTNQLERVGGLEYLTRIIESVPSAANALYYAEIVKDRQKYRNMLRTLEDMKNVINEPLDVKAQIQKIQDIAFEIEKADSLEFFSLTDHVEEISQTTDEKKNVINSGFRNIDRFTGGFAPGELIIVAGRPSMGKTAIALQFALTAAKAGLSIIFFTLEMTHRAIIERALKDDTVNCLKVFDIIFHESCHTPEKQIAFIKTYKQSHKVDMVLIDYLQLMTSGKRSEGRVQEVATMSRKLKLASVSENIPIIVLCQLNRQVEHREKHRPRMSDLRESGSIENDADIVLLLHREDYYRRNDNPDYAPDGNAEVIIAKNRTGPTGVAKLVFIEDIVKFGDKADEFVEDLI